jgi:hypothetical protein
LETVRHPRNTIAIPTGWSSDRAAHPEFFQVDQASGFMARAYQRGNEIVIAYAGTTDEAGAESLDWINGNVPAAAGYSLAPQVLQAALFYQEVKRLNPSASISFTGHSMGGGLAGLMAVYFDRPAYAFDPAPFANSASRVAVVEQLAASLRAAGYNDSSLNAYQAAALTAAITQLPNGELQRRQSGITSAAIAGEALSASVAQALFFTALGATRIGSVQQIDLNAQAIDRFALAGLPHPVDLHSMTLLTGVLLNNDFKTALQNNPRILARLFRGNEERFAQNNPKDDEANLTDLLVQRELRGEGTLAQLAADVGKINRTEGLSAANVTNAGPQADITLHVQDLLIDSVLAGLYEQTRASRGQVLPFDTRGAANKKRFVPWLRAGIGSRQIGHVMKRRLIALRGVLHAAQRA